MNLLPKIKKCPHCETLNFVRINGIIYDNEFQTLKDWTLKSKILCRKCKIEVGLFINNHDSYFINVKVSVYFIFFDLQKRFNTYVCKISLATDN